MALRSLIFLVLIPLCFAGFPELQHAQVELPEAFQGAVANRSSNGVIGLEIAQNLFERQSCPVGQNNCGFVGDCCPVNSGNTCCGLLCLATQPEGTQCCPGYLCASGFKCCGETNGCYPDGGECCSRSSGEFCPKDWGCCGNSGHCYPTKDFKCCGNDGTYCPKSDTCVICKGSDSRTCCQGADNAQIPVFKADAVTGNGSLAIPNPSTVQEVSQSGASASHSTTKSAAAASSSSSAAAATTSGSPSTTRAPGTSTTAAGGGGSGGSLMKFDWNFAVALGMASVALLL